VAGVAELVFPDLGVVTAVLDIEDPLGDDNGPGTYTYPEDAVFTESVYDAQSFTVGYTDENLVLTIGFPVPIENAWNSAIGLSIQTVDVYIDTDPGAGTGARLLLPGRNAALEEGYGWEYAVWAEGWTSQVLQSDPETLEPKEYTEATSGLKVFVDTARNAVVIRVPLTFLPEGDPATWGYAAAVMGQEGYPAEGVWRVRDVSVQAAQWLFGGAPVDINHTRIIDLLLPAGSDPDQAAILSGYTGATGSLDALTPDDFAQIPMLLP
jgi:carbohydrate-binding DOMON domain-containing protein